MGVATFEGIVEQGRIWLHGSITLPERTKVYLVVPDFEAQKQVHVRSPRLLHPEQAADFAKEIVEVHSDTRM